MLPRTSQASCPRPERFPVHHVFLTEVISMTKPASDTDHPPFGEPPRTLTEDVLQSAEEAVLSNPASVAGMPEQGLPSAPKIADAAVTETDRRTRMHPMPFATKPESGNQIPPEMPPPVMPPAPGPGAPPEIIEQPPTEPPIPIREPGKVTPIQA